MLSMNWFSLLKVKFIPGSDAWGKSDVLEDVQHVFMPESEDNHVRPDQEENGIDSGSNTIYSEAEEDTDDGQENLPAVGLAVCEELQDLTNVLTQVGQETSPLFVRVGRDLQAIFGETKTLTDSIRSFAGSVQSNEGEKSSLDRTKQLIREVSQRLAEDQDEIEGNLKQVLKLRANLSKFHHVYDTIDRISASFRVVRINIQIQCKVQSISEDLFNGVAGDITSLSQKLNEITKQIKKDLFDAEKNISGLNNTVSKNLQKIKRVSAESKGIMSKAFAEIEQLVQGASSMVRDIGDKSEVISQKVGEVVTSIQFHDAMSQRFEHIVLAFNDIQQLLKEKDPTPECLGRAYFILDLQYRQLVHLTSEIRSIHGNITNSFETMGTKVEQLDSLMRFMRLKSSDQQQHVASQFSTLQQALVELCDMFAQVEEMVDQINNSTAVTTKVAGNLMQFMGNIQDMREETRLQVANTIIMASSLGEKGKTIEVLAKEMRSLSDKTSALTSDVTEIYETMNHLIKKLGVSAVKEASGICHVDNLEKELEMFRQSFEEIEYGRESVSHQIDLTSTHIQSVRDNLSFLEDLKTQLLSLTAEINDVRDTLAPWQDEASIDSRETEQLIERYSMEKERMIHMHNGEFVDKDAFFAENRLEDKGNQKEQDEQDENVEFF